MTELVLACDCGTTALKALLVDTDGHIRSEAHEQYPLLQPHLGWAEQRPEDLWDAVARASRRAVAAADVDPAAVVAVVIVASWKGIVPITTSEGALGPALLWLDARAGQHAARLNERLGAFVATGQEYWPRLMWLKEHQPDVWDRAEYLVGLNTYLKWRATGVVCTEPSDDFVHSPDPDTQGWYDAVLDAADLDRDRAKFAVSLSSTAEIGTLTPAASAAMGLTTATRVFNGFGDLPAITVGSGRAEVGDTHLYFGTSSWFVEMLRTRRGSDAPLHFTLGEQREGGTHALQSGCLAYEWAVTRLYPEEADRLGPAVHDLVAGEVDDVPPGSLDLLATHWLHGELPPLSKNAKGLFLNLTPQHDRRHMVRAMMESICYAHRLHVEDHSARTGLDLEAVLAVGGGAVSDVWMQILADVLQRTVEVPTRPQHTGAMGAYYCALVGLGHLDGYAAVRERVVVERRLHPNPDRAETYDRLYAIHQQLYPALRPLFDQLNGEP